MSRHSGLSLDPTIVNSLISVGGQVVGSIGANKSNRFIAESAARQAEANARIEELRSRAAAASAPSFKPGKDDNSFGWVLGSVAVLTVVSTGIFLYRASSSNSADDKKTRA